MVAGKSEKQQVIVFINYENCNHLTEIALNIYTELIIFAGGKQNNVALSVNAFPEAVKVTLWHVSEVSRNLRARLRYRPDSAGKYCRMTSGVSPFFWKNVTMSGGTGVTDTWQNSKH